MVAGVMYSRSSKPRKRLRRLRIALMAIEFLLLTGPAILYLAYAHRLLGESASPPGDFNHTRAAWEGWNQHELFIRPLQATICISLLIWVAYYWITGRKHSWYMLFACACIALGSIWLILAW